MATWNITAFSLRTQVNCARPAQSRTDLAKRASSRSSAPKLLTTALQVIASDMAAPSRLSASMCFALAGATQLANSQ